MIFRFTLLLCCLVLFLAGCFKGEQVDLIIHNANIHTMDEKLSVAEAMAVKDGKIILVGSEREILNRFTAKKEINAEQKDIYPGFHDGHGHILGLAYWRLEANLIGTSSFGEMLERIEAFQNKNDLEFIVGRGWDHSLWGDSTMPNFDLLNKHYPTIPVALTRVDGHAMLVNQAALDLAGITTETTVHGGKIEKINGQLTGILLDNAMDLIMDFVPSTEKEQLKQSILEIQDELLALGITHVHEAGLNYEEFKLLDELAESGELKLGIYGMLFPTEKNKAFVEKEGLYKNKQLSVRSFKILMDGALGSHGACMLKPYRNKPSEKGFLLTDITEMEQHTDFAKKHGYQVNTHCIGDSANRVMLKRIEELMSDEPDHRWRIEHAQVIHPNDFDLFASSGAIPSVQPTHATTDQRWAASHIGDERLKGAYAYKDLLEKRKIIIFGTDFPVEDFDPFATIHAAVQRKNTENEPLAGFLIEQAVTLEACLKAMTTWAAYGCFEESNLGKLEKGKQATFVIFDHPVKSGKQFLQNYAKVTVINGEVVFDMDVL